MKALVWDTWTHSDKFACKKHIYKLTETGDSEISNNYVRLTSSAACAALWAHGDESLVSSEVRERKTSRAPSTQINPDVKMNYSSIYTHKKNGLLKSMWENKQHSNNYI